jgi:hypothetical protein
MGKNTAHLLLCLETSLENNAKPPDQYRMAMKPDDRSKIACSGQAFCNGKVNDSTERPRFNSLKTNFRTRKPLLPVGGLVQFGPMENHHRLVIYPEDGS